MERIKFESFWLGSPAFADVFVGREPLQGLQPSSVVVGINEVGEVCFELIVSVVMVALDGGFLDRAVHALDLAIGPGMLDLSQPMFDAILLAAHIEHMCRVSCRRTVGVARREGELDSVVGEDRVDLVGHSRDQSLEEGRGGGPSHLPDQLHEGELAGAIDGDVEVELAFSGLELSDVDVEIADRISLELFLRGLAAFDLWQLADAVALETAMQGRSRQMRDGRLERIETIVERQQGMPPESDDDRLPMESTVDLDSFGPVGRSATVLRSFHFATVFWLIP